MASADAGLNPTRPGRRRCGANEGNDPVTGKPLMKEVIGALTDPLTLDEEKSGTVTPSMGAATFVDTQDNLQKYYMNNGMTDFMSIIIPTKDKVDAMLEGTSHDPEEAIGENSRRPADRFRPGNLQSGKCGDRCSDGGSPARMSFNHPGHLRDWLAVCFELDQFVCSGGRDQPSHSRQARYELRSGRRECVDRAGLDDAFEESWELRLGRRNHRRGVIYKCIQYE